MSLAAGKRSFDASSAKRPSSGAARHPGSGPGQALLPAVGRRGADSVLDALDAALAARCANDAAPDVGRQLSGKLRGGLHAARSVIVGARSCSIEETSLDAGVLQLRSRGAELQRW